MATKKADTGVPAESLELLDKLIETIPGIERKGAAMPYTSVNGQMFSFIAKDGSLALRLPEAAREAFTKKYKTSLAEQHGTLLKEYVAVPNALFKKTKELKPYFEESYTYVKSLKPKPTTKPKSGKK